MGERHTIKEIVFIKKIITISDVVKNFDDESADSVYSSVSNSVIAQLNANDNIGMVIYSPTTGTISFENGVNGVFIVKKIRLKH